MIAWLGLALFHFGGALLRQLLTRCGWWFALKSPSSAWFGLGLAYIWALGVAGIPMLLTLVGIAFFQARETTREKRSLWGAGLVLFVLARPWVPTQWDEFVWLAKARFESLGFGKGIWLALDAAQQVIPAGYPPLWPAAVGWLSLGHDSLHAHVLAGSLLVLLCAATALEAMALTKTSWVDAAVLLSAPLIWVHLRSTYVDLPVGLLGLAVLGHLLRSPERPPLIASVLALVLAGFKDEGLPLVLSASVGALVVWGWRRWRLALPAVMALVSVATWRWLVSSHGVPLFDHSLGFPLLAWVPRLIQLVVVHATDIYSWGIFWPLTLAAFFTRTSEPTARALRVMLSIQACFTAAALLCGPERVRVFAENGTLLNRLLVQLWPCAVILVMLMLRQELNDRLSIKSRAV